MSDAAPNSGPPTERLVKSLERVAERGEVFTPRRLVDDMLDLLPETTWSPHPSPTFLEPACGDGNFLVAILERKLVHVSEAWRARRLPAGSDAGALTFHALEALSSIYGMDISTDNVLGGVPEHPIGARDRLLTAMQTWMATLEHDLSDAVLAAGRWIVERNVQIADMLPSSALGSPPDDVPLVAYAWRPRCREVRLSLTTLADAIARAQADDLSLFGAPELVPLGTVAPERLPFVELDGRGCGAAATTGMRTA